MSAGTLLLVGAGCVLALSETELERTEDGFTDRTRATVVAKEGCRSIDVLLPPGGRWLHREARVRFGDGGKNRLDPDRWQALPRGDEGWARARLHVPELLGGDRVEIDVQRQISSDHYDWTPGEEGARFAELELPRRHDDGLVDAFSVQPQRRGFWVSEPGAEAAVRVWWSAQARDSDVVWSLGHPALDLPPPASPRPGQVTASPAEATSAVSRFRLLPDRPDLDVTGVPGVLAERDAAVLLGITAELPLAAVVDARTPARPPAVIPYASKNAGVAPRVWSHPDAAWDPAWRLLTPTGPVSPVGAPAGPGPRMNDPVEIDRVLRLVLPDGADPRVALVPGGGSVARFEDEIRFSNPQATETQVRLLTAPRGGQLAAPPAVDGTGRAIINSTGDQVLLVAPPGRTARFTVQWQAPDAPTCGGPPSAGITRSVEAPGAELRDDAQGFWLHAWGDVPLATDRQRVINGLNARFNRRSLPEPGLPMRLRGRLSGWDLVAELPDTLRQRAVVAPLPAQDHLWPRRLHAARNSGVVSPIEAALITRLYAMQAKVQADWVLVRSATAPPGPELCADSYDSMLVRLELDGEVRWLDPACEACAPFEVRPELLGQPALGRGVKRSPEPVAGSLDVQITGPEVRWHLKGPAALELRQWLRARPVEGRAQALAERMAGEGAALQSVTGATERGVPIVAVATAARRASMPDPATALLPASGGVVTWPGPRQVSIEGGEPRVIRLEIGSWDRERERHARETLGLQTFTER